MGKLKNNEKGFGAIEVLLTLIFLALVVLIGVYVAHNHSTSKSSTSTTSTTPATSASSGTSMKTPTMHTPQEASTFVQTTYDDYLSAINNAGTNNTQPLGLVGLAAVKGNLTSDFYTQAAASHNGSSFSCAAQFEPSKYVVGSATASGATASVPVTLWNSTDGSTTTSGMTVNVDLTSLKITAVSCPS